MVGRIEDHHIEAAISERQRLEVADDVRSSRSVAIEPGDLGVGRGTLPEQPPLPYVASSAVQASGKNTDSDPAITSAEVPRSIVWNGRFAVVKLALLHADRRSTAAEI